MVWISASRERRKPLLVGVQDGDEAHFWQVETFAQQVDAHEHVNLAGTELPENLDALHRDNIAMEIADFLVFIRKELRHILGHFFRERGDEHALAALLA